ncbi:hypothetical protein [Tissierella sp.]|uniref:hypothetical protein n=1 Tax=Tissierella sp. TaxID=41274 RepID=UPI00303E68E3
MKKFSVITMIIVILFSSSLSAFAAPPTSNQRTTRIESVDAERNTIIEYLTPIDTTAEVKFFDEEKLNSKSVMSGDRTYLYSLYRYDYSQIIQHNSKSKINDKFICSVPLGKTFTTTKTVETSGSVSFEGSVDSNQKEAVNKSFGLNAQGSLTVTVQQSETYTFHDSLLNKGFNVCDYYLAVGFDKYKVVLKKIDVYQVKVGNWGFQTEEVFDKNVDVLAHKPKKVEYPVGVKR